MKWMEGDRVKKDMKKMQEHVTLNIDVCKKMISVDEHRRYFLGSCNLTSSYGNEALLRLFVC